MYVYVCRHILFGYTGTPKKRWGGSKAEQQNTHTYQRIGRAFEPTLALNIQQQQQLHVYERDYLMHV